jgi:hypothetical protein
MAFDDGTPLDAAKLQSLETELNNVKASIPKIGSSTINIDASSTTNQTIVQSQIVGGITTTAEKVAAGAEISPSITFTGLNSDPISVSVTPIKSSGSLKHITWHISGTPTRSGCVVKVHNGGTTEQQLRFAWIAICGNK